MAKASEYKFMCLIGIASAIIAANFTVTVYILVQINYVKDHQTVDAAASGTRGAHTPDKNIGVVLPCTAPKNVNLMELFHSYIIGNFDNRAQFNDEMINGQYVHAMAQHISGDVTSKVINLPATKQGFFILEESYYMIPGLSRIASPFLFYFDENCYNKCVRLTAYDFPSEIPLNQLRNNNTNLLLDFAHMSISTQMKPTSYSFNAATATFSLSSITPQPDGSRFLLQETIGARRLAVLEQIIYPNGTILPGYTTPILYDRSISNFDDLLSSLSHGYTIRMDAFYGKCSPPPARAIGGDSLHNAKYINDALGQRIIFSRAKFIANYQGGRLPYVYDFVRTTVFRGNGTVRFFASDVYPDTWAAVYEETFDCQIYNPVTTKGSAHFYVTNTSPPPKLLSNYKQLFTYITSGRQVRFVRKTTICKQVGQQMPIDAMNFGLLETFEEFNDSRIAPYSFFGFAEQSLLKNDGKFLGWSRYLWNYVPASVYFNGTVTWSDTLVDPQLFQAAQYSPTVCQMQESSTIRTAGTIFYVIN